MAVSIPNWRQIARCTKSLPTTAIDIMFTSFGSLGKGFLPRQPKSVAFWHFPISLFHHLPLLVESAREIDASIGEKERFFCPRQPRFVSSARFKEMVRLFSSPHIHRETCKSACDKSSLQDHRLNEPASGNADRIAVKRCERQNLSRPTSRVSSTVSSRCSTNVRIPPQRSGPVFHLSPPLPRDSDSSLLLSVFYRLFQSLLYSSLFSAFV